MLLSTLQSPGQPAPRKSDLVPNVKSDLVPNVKTAKVEKHCLSV